MSNLVTHYASHFNSYPVVTFTVVVCRHCSFQHAYCKCPPPPSFKSHSVIMCLLERYNNDFSVLLYVRRAKVLSVIKRVVNLALALTVELLAQYVIQNASNEGGL